MRELTTGLKTSRTSLSPEVQRLERLGLLRSRQVGPAILYRVDESRRRQAVQRLVEEFDESQLALF